MRKLSYGLSSKEALMDYAYLLGLLFIASVLGNLIWDGVKRLWEHHKYPFRWKCPQCDFYIRTNVWETYEVSKSIHNHSSTKEYKTQ